MDRDAIRVKRPHRLQLATPEGQMARQARHPGISRRSRTRLVKARDRRATSGESRDPVAEEALTPQLQAFLLSGAQERRHVLGGPTPIDSRDFLLQRGF